MLSTALRLGSNAFHKTGAATTKAQRRCLMPWYFLFHRIAQGVKQNSFVPLVLFMGLGDMCKKRSRKPSVKCWNFTCTHDEWQKRQNKYTRLELKYYCWYCCQGSRSRKLVDDNTWTTQIWRVCLVRKDEMSYWRWNDWKKSVYVMVLAFATIEDVNICRSRQLSFLAAAKKVSSNRIVWKHYSSFWATVPVSPDFYSMLKLSELVYYKLAKHYFAWCSKNKYRVLLKI